MKYYLIFGSHKTGFYTSTVLAKNKYSAIERVKEYSKVNNFIPIICKRVPKKYGRFIAQIQEVKL